MIRIVRTSDGWGLQEGSDVRGLAYSLAEMLRGAPIERTETIMDSDLMAPVDLQPVWAAGVTYEGSLVARTEESLEPDVYERVYSARRPELFYKCDPNDVVGPDGAGAVRSDSGWNVPEPELVLVLDCAGEVFGYTIGDDISSRSIEGENPLYLPQAKVYAGSCVIGPWIVPASQVSAPFEIKVAIHRQTQRIFEASISTAKMRRSFGELARWLYRGLSFPHGAMLMTGTGLVPTDDVTLQRDDRVSISVDGIGTLNHSIDVLNVGEDP